MLKKPSIPQMYFTECAILYLWDTDGNDFFFFYFHRFATILIFTINPYNKQFIESKSAISVWETDRLRNLLVIIFLYVHSFFAAQF